MTFDTPVSPRTPIADRIAAAPISWGVCEVPDWGYQLSPDRVLTEMAELGVAATEFGPDGFLPADPHAAADLLASHGMRAVGGFVPAVLFDDDRDPLPDVERALRHFTAAGATSLVLAAATGQDGYDTRPELDAREWATLLARLDDIRRVAADLGIEATLHPHVGTLVESRDEVDRVLDGSSVGLTLDTGHLLVGGVDPVVLTAEAADRIKHAHLKDVVLAQVERIRSGELTYTEAVKAGLYAPLGRGDVDVTDIVRTLEGSGYDGWYVMEQDVVLDAEPPAGAGPRLDVRRGLEFLRGIEDGANGSST